MLAIYTRVSTEKQSDGYSLPQQREEGISFAQSQGMSYQIFEDVKSGNDITRQGWVAMMEAIRDGEVDAVWTSRFNRFARNTRDALDAVEVMTAQGVKFFVQSTQYDLADHNVILLLTIQFGLATKERADIISASRKGKRRQIDSGNRTYAYLLGYDFRYRPDGTTEWFPIDEEAQIVKYIFSLYQKGLNYGQIACRLNDEGYLGKRYKALKWERSTISKVLKRPEYCGLTRNTAGELIKSNIYEPIIDRSLWERVNKDINTRAIQRSARVVRFAAYDLSSIIKCTKCGTGFYFHLQTKVKPGRTIRYERYAHKQVSTKAKSCTQYPKYIPREEIEEVFSIIYVDFLSDKEELKRYAEKVRRETSQDRKKLQSDIDRLRQRLDEIETQRKRIIDGVMTGLWGQDDIRDQILDLNDQKEKFLVQIDEREKRLQMEDDENHKIIQQIQNEELADHFRATPPEKRHAYMRAIKSATIEDKTVTVEFLTGKTYQFQIGDYPQWIEEQRKERVENKRIAAILRGAFRKKQ